MRYPRALIAEMGWAIPLAVAALCMLVFFSALVVFRVDGETGPKPSSVEAEVTAVPLAVPARPSSAPGADDGGGLSP
jgi:hypothetical protein